MIQEVNQGGFKITDISESFAHLLSIGENQQLKTDDNLSVDSSIVENEQLMVNTSLSTVENRQLLNKYKETNNYKKNKNKETLVINKELPPNDFKISLTNSCNDFYNEFSPSRWNKKQWNTLVEAFVTETISEGRYINVPADKIQGYAYQSLKNIAYKFDLKNERIDFENTATKRKFPFYNWLEADNDEEMPY
ncbi:hypothetical protein M1D86_05980 [Bacillus sp. PK3-137]